MTSSRIVDGGHYTADNLAGIAIFFLSLAVGLITGAAGILLATQTDWLDTFENTLGDKKVIAFL